MRPVHRVALPDAVPHDVLKTQCLLFGGSNGVGSPLPYGGFKTRRYHSCHLAVSTVAASATLSRCLKPPRFDGRASPTCSIDRRSSMHDGIDRNPGGSPSPAISGMGSRPPAFSWPFGERGRCRSDKIGAGTRLAASNVRETIANAQRNEAKASESATWPTVTAES